VNALDDNLSAGPSLPILEKTRDIPNIALILGGEGRSIAEKMSGGVLVSDDGLET